jgi:hypothetical protein
MEGDNVAINEEEGAAEPLTRIEQMRSMAQAPIFLPSDHARERAFPAIAITIAATTAIYFLSSPIATKIFTPEDKASKAAHRKLCYQITNVCTNLVLGMLGIYFEYWRLPENAGVVEKTQGQEDFYIFGAMQIGYQVWGLIVGAFVVGEKVEMMFHHLAVIFVGCMSTFLTNGFRYWIPFFFGVFEISSVPLGVMNMFKDNNAWITAYPTIYVLLRAAFAFSFLFIRVYMLHSRQYEYLWDAFLLPYTMEGNIGIRMYYFVCWISSAFLSILQVYWAYLIVSGIAKVLGKKKKRKHKAN